MTIHDTDVALTEAAPSEDATQSIHAWSQTDDNDTELVITHRRSWKLPIAVAVLATAAAAGGVYQAWPQQHSAPAPARSAPVQVVPVPINRPLSPGDRFVSLLKAQGFIETGTDAQVVATGQQICGDLTAGRYTLPQVIDGIANGTGITQAHATRFAETSINVFCPQYSN